MNDTAKAPELWDVQQIAAFYRQSVKQVRDRTTHKPGFPKPIRGSERPKLYVAQEVMDYALNRGVEQSRSRSHGSNA